MAAKPATIPDRFLIPEEAAAMLRIKHPQTLAEWRSQGRGPAYIKDGNGYVRYLESDIFAWARANRVDPAA